MHAVLLLFRPLLNAGIQNFGLWGMYSLVKAYRSIKKSITKCWVEDWEVSSGHTKDTTRLFQGPWPDPVRNIICAQPFRMSISLHFHPFLQVSQIFQGHKSNANKQDFENKLNLTCQAQSSSKTIVRPTHRKLKFLVVKIWCYQLKELVLTKPKLFDFFKYLNF